MSTSEQDCKDRTHETHTCDLISRQAAIDALDEICDRERDA